MYLGLFLALCTGLSWASISAIMSNVAKYRIPTFLFYTMGATFTAAVSWIFMVNWQMAVNLSASKILVAVPCFLLPGAVNVLSQTVMVHTLKTGHNGISIAIRNCGGTVPFLVGYFFLGNKVTVLNFVGMVMIFTGLTLIATGCKNNNDKTYKFSSAWLIAATASMLLSGTFQTLNTLITGKFPYIIECGMATPLIMSSCSAGYAIAYICSEKQTPASGISGDVCKYALLWGIMALLSYFFMFKTLDVMGKHNVSALVFPLVMGVNVSMFFVYSKIRLREPYSMRNVISLLLCICGVIMLAWH